MLGQRLLEAAMLVDIRAFAACGKVARGGKLECARIAGITVAVQRGDIDVERSIFLHPTFGNQLVDRRGFEMCPPQFLGQDLHGLGLRSFTDFQQRIGFERLADEGFHLEVRQRQQLDRLLELRRHHQRLGLPDVQPRPESHPSDSPRVQHQLPPCLTG